MGHGAKKPIAVAVGGGLSIFNRNPLLLVEYRGKGSRRGSAWRGRSVRTILPRLCKGEGDMEKGTVMRGRSHGW